jgi:hypothetical protein
MADITKVKVILNTGVAVNVAAPDDSILSVSDAGAALDVFNAASQRIASFTKGDVAYWTTDLAEIS